MAETNYNLPVIFKAIGFASTPFALVIMATSITESKKKQHQIPPEQREQINESYQRVKDLTEQAEKLWKDGLTFIAKEKLQEIDRMPYGKNSNAARRLRSRIANAEVDALIKEAENAIENESFALAGRKIQEALNVPKATELDIIHPNHIESFLIDMSNEDFTAFEKCNKMPNALVSGHDILDNWLFETAQANVDKVSGIREQRRQARIDAREKHLQSIEDRERLIAKKARDNRIRLMFYKNRTPLKRIIKAAMYDPSSYEHVYTTYYDKGDHLVVRTTFRGKNAFGGIVKNSVKVKIDSYGNVLSVIDQD